MLKLLRGEVNKKMYPFFNALQYEIENYLLKHNKIFQEIGMNDLEVVIYFRNIHDMSDSFVTAIIDPSFLKQNKPTSCGANFDF